MHNIHERANDIRGKFAELAKNFSGTVIVKIFPLLAKLRKKNRHLRKNFRELLIYMLLRESSFNLFSIHLTFPCTCDQVAKDCYYQRNQVVEIICDLV